jgi:hypothetical protein
MRGLNWLGLPRPKETRDPSLFVRETQENGHAREQRQLRASALIDGRGVGRRIFDASGGWGGAEGQHNEKFQRACAEWADGELVGAHIGYENDVLCTNDKARGAGKSIFDTENCAWLTSEFGVAFRGVDELVAELATLEQAISDKRAAF